MKTSLSNFMLHPIENKKKGTIKIPQSMYFSCNAKIPNIRTVKGISK